MPGRQADSDKGPVQEDLHRDRAHRRPLSGSLASAASAQSDEAAVIAVVDALHSALSTGDSTKGLAQLAEDVTILESGGVETLEQYRSSLLRGDMRFAPAVSRKRGEIRVTVAGDVAWAHSTSVTRGRMGEQDINSQGAELMVLARVEETWRIKAIHSSSRQRPNQ